MELQLRAFVGGALHTFHSHRLLKVNHRPVAYVTPHIDGWYLFALVPEASMVAVNQIYIETPTILMVGDTVSIHTMAYTVEAADCTGVGSFEPGREETVCQIRHSADECGMMVYTQAIIGTDENCTYQLPLDVQKAAQPWHGLVARVRKRWLFYNFQHRTLPGQTRTMPWTPIQDDDELTINGVTFRFSIYTEEEAYAFDSVETALETQENLATDTERDLDLESDHHEPASLLNRDDPEHAAEQLEKTDVVDSEYDPLAPMMIQLCYWLKKAISEAKQQMPITPPVELMIDDPKAKKLNQLLRKLASNPIEYSYLLNFAEFSREHFYLQTWRVTIKELCKLNPNNYGLMLTYIDACHQVSKLPEMTLSDKMRMLDEADQYADKLSRLGKESPELHDLRIAISSDRLMYHLKS